VYEHVPRWRKRLPVPLIGCGFASLVIGAIVTATLVFDSPWAGQAAFVGLVLLVTLLTKTATWRRLAERADRMDHEARVEYAEQRALRIRGRGAPAIWAEHSRLTTLGRQLPPKACEDLRARYTRALDVLTSAARAANPSDPEGLEARRAERRVAWIGVVLIVAGVAWAVTVAAAHPGPSLLHFQPWLPATAGFMLLLRHQTPVLRWAGSSLFGLLAVLVPQILV